MTNREEEADQETEIAEEALLKRGDSLNLPEMRPTIDVASISLNFPEGLERVKSERLFLDTAPSSHSS